MLIKFSKQEEDELIRFSNLHGRHRLTCDISLVNKVGDKIEGTNKEVCRNSAKNILDEAGRDGCESNFSRLEYQRQLRALLPSSRTCEFPLRRIDVSRMSINEAVKLLDEMRKKYTYATIKRDASRDVTEIICYAVYPKVI